MRRKFLTDRRGNIAMLTAILMPVMLCAVGAGIDFTRWTIQSANLKEASDLLATRGAREFLLANATGADIKAVLNAAISNNIGDTYNLGGFQHEITVDIVENTVSVTLAQPTRPGLILTKFYPYSEDISVTSTAVARGGSNVCVVVLERVDSEALSAKATASMSAPDCGVLSNSTSTQGVRVTGVAKISAGVICSAGGYFGGFLNYDPAPTTDCPVYPDPLAHRAPPSYAGCDFIDYTIGDPNSPPLPATALAALADVVAHANGNAPNVLPGFERHDLTPGVYCGGIHIIDTSADVHLAPGVYVMKDGDLIVERGARLFAEHVGFYFDGANSTFAFEPASIIHITAPKTGPMAGLLFWESDNSAADQEYRISSANARELLGTIYLKKGTLIIDSKRPIADSSAYTAIVANKLEMKGSPTLKLNADYSATDVPVPAGVGPLGGATYLRE